MNVLDIDSYRSLQKRIAMENFIHVSSKNTGISSGTFIAVELLALEYACLRSMLVNCVLT